MNRPTQSAVKRAASVLVAGVLLVQASMHGTYAHLASSDFDIESIAGRRMFFGESPLLGTITGHPEPLPPRVVACANCHLADTGKGSAAAFAPELNRSTLTQPRRRRGGPPSLFSPASFCRLLRIGVDPAYIVIPRSMPRYSLDDNQCLDLWRYLTEVPDAHAQE